MGGGGREVKGGRGGEVKGDEGGEVKGSRELKGGGMEGYSKSDVREVVRSRF